MHFTTSGSSHRPLTNTFCSDPEPAAAATAVVAPAPPAPTATTNANAPHGSEAKTGDMSNQPLELIMPTLPTKEPAQGMSATSGPLGDEPDFGTDVKEEAPPAPGPTPAVTTTTSDAHAPESTTVPTVDQPISTEK